MKKFFVKLLHAHSGDTHFHEVIAAENPEAAETVARSKALHPQLHGLTSEVSEAPVDAAIGPVETSKTPVFPGGGSQVAPFTSEPTASEALGDGGTSPYGAPGMPQSPEVSNQAEGS